MVRPAQRLTDPNNAGGRIINTDGNTTVYANNLLVSVDTSLVSYGRGRTTTANGSNSVFAHNVPINYTDNNDTDGRVRIEGSPDVFVADDIDQDSPSIRVIIEGDEEEAATPPAPVGGLPRPGRPYVPPPGASAPPPTGPGNAYYQEKVNSGVVSQREVQRENNVSATGASAPPPSTNRTPSTTDPGDVGEEFPDSLVLSPRFTLGRLTKKPGVVFEHSVTKPNVQGIPAKTIVENLKLLAINTLEPIYAKYPNAFVTNTFRPDSKTQHGKGQAADIQFRNISKAEYYNIALWIRDNIPFDQLLLEYKTTGSGLPWIHISFSVPQRAASDPTKVMTFLNDRRETKTAANGYGLIQLAEA